MVLSVFVFILLLFAHQAGYSQETPKQHDSSKQPQEPILATGTPVRSVRKVAVVGM